MGSMPRSFVGIRRTKRRPNPPPQRRFCKPPQNKSRIINNSSVSDKLDALKNLVPVHIDSGEIKPDQLFQQTADYIVLLRTQISVLQQLVDFYGSDAASAAAAQPQQN